MSSSLSRPARILLLALIVASALVFRLWQISSIPPGFHFDESFEALEAFRIFIDSTYRPIFLEGNFGVAPLNAYVTALGFAMGALFGIAPGPTLARGTNALVGVATVLAIYALASELRRHDRAGRLSAWFPLWAAATIAIMRWHVHFSRMAIEPIWVPLEWALAIWWLLRGWRTGSWLAFAGAGAVTALSIYTYQGAWVLPFVVAASAIGLVLQAWLARDHLTPGPSPVNLAPNPSPEERGAPSPLSFGEGLGARLSRARRRGLAISAIVAVVLAAPLLFYFWQHLDLIVLRPTQVNVVGETASPADAGVLANTWASIAMYFPIDGTGDMDPRRNLPGAPALNLWLALPFWLGVALAIRRIKRTPYWITLLGLVGLLSVGVFTEYAPHFHRILGAVAPTAILCAFGLDAIWTWRPARAGFLRWSAVALIVLGAIGGWRDYFVRWAALPDLYYAFDEGLWQVGNWIADQPVEEPIYLSPRDASHPTLAFAWQTRPGAHGAPVTFDGRSVFPVVEGATPGEEKYVSITHEDFRTPLLLPEALPDAVESEHFVDWAGNPYARVWTRPANSNTARSPFVQRTATLGDGIHLHGYDAQPAEVHPGEVLYVQLHWLVDEAPKRDWTVYVHLTDPSQPEAPPVASRDEQPGGGSLPTARWQAGWRVLDEHQLQLPANLPAGTYEIVVGMYDGGGALGAPITLGEVSIQP